MFRATVRNSIRPFALVSIETRSGCNYDCSFCPVSRSVDPRAPGEMSYELLQKIAAELSDLRFSGMICLFGNNEPLLDERMPGLVRMFSSECPQSKVRILTNGTYVSVPLVTELFEAGLARLTINNYTDGQRLIAPVRSLVRAAGQLFPFDIRVSVRSRVEVLTTRAGTAPNKQVPAFTPTGFCGLPFTDIYVSYTGAVNLCSFDAYGQVPMGNVTDLPLMSIWQSEGFQHYRDNLLRSVRAGLTLCQNCDYDGFRNPDDRLKVPLIRQDLEIRLEQQLG